MNSTEVLAAGDISPSGEQKMPINRRGKLRMSFVDEPAGERRAYRTGRCRL